MIAFDFDDVIYDLNDLLEKKFLEYFNHDIIPGYQKDYYIEVPGKSGKEVGEFVGYVIKKYHDEAPPVEGSIEAIKKIYNEFHIPIIIITARGEERLKSVTECWLNKYLGEAIPFKVFYTDHIINKSPTEDCKNAVSSKIPKSRYIKENNIQYFVDDRYDNIKEVAPACRTAFLFNKPWNLKESVFGNIYRVNDLFDIYDFLKNIQ